MPKFWIVKIWINVAWYLLTFLCALKVSSGDLIRFFWNLYATVVIFCFHYVVVKMLIKSSMYQFYMNLEISKMHFSLSKLCLVCSLHANNWFQNNLKIFGNRNCCCVSFLSVIFHSHLDPKFSVNFILVIIHISYWDFWKCIIIYTGIYWNFFASLEWPPCCTVNI